MQVTGRGKLRLNQGTLGAVPVLLQAYFQPHLTVQAWHELVITSEVTPCHLYFELDLHFQDLLAALGFHMPFL